MEMNYCQERSMNYENTFVIGADEEIYSLNRLTWLLLSYTATRHTSLSSCVCARTRVC